jgi:hypothetical protein
LIDPIHIKKNQIWTLTTKILYPTRMKILNALYPTPKGPKKTHKWRKNKSINHIEPENEEIPYQYIDNNHQK